MTKPVYYSQEHIKIYLVLSTKKERKKTSKGLCACVCADHFLESYVQFVDGWTEAIELGTDAIDNVE